MSPDLTGLPAHIILRKSRRTDEPMEEIFHVHRPRLIELAEHHRLVYSVVEDIVSGAESVKADRIFGQVMRETEEGRSKVWVCMDVDRLARPDPEDAGKILKCVQRNGVYILTPDRVYDPENWDDLIFLKVKLFLADWELTTYRRRVAVTREHIVRKESRHPNGASPFAYTWDKQNRHYVPNADYACLIRIFKDIQQMGTTHISRMLRQEFAVTMSPQHVYRALTNPFYAGFPCQRSRYRAGEREVLGRDDWIWPDKEGDYIHPVTLEEWRGLQRLMAGRRTAREKPDSSYWATGVIQCVNCNCRLVGSGGRYKCTTTARAYGRCSGTSIRADKVHRLLLPTLARVFQGLQENDGLLKVALGELERKRNSAEAIVGAAARSEKGLADLRESGKRLLKLYLAGGIAMEAYLEEKRVHDERITRAQVQYESLTRSASAPVVSERTMVTLRDICGNFDLVWQHLSNSERRQVCRLILADVRLEYARPGGAGNGRKTLRVNRLQEPFHSLLGLR